MVEVRRIPDTTDVLALYEVEVDERRRPPGLPTGAPLRPRRARGGLSDDRVAEPGATSRPYAHPPDAVRGRPQPANLADILERVLDKGIIIAGDIRVNLLDIELLTIKIRLLIVSVDKAAEMGIDWWRNDPMLLTTAQGPGPRRTAQLRERLEELEAGPREPSRGTARVDG